MLQRSPAPVKSGGALRVLLLTLAAILAAVAVMTILGKGKDSSPRVPIPTMTVNPSPQPDHNARVTPSPSREGRVVATLPSRGPRYTYLVSVAFSTPRRESLHMTLGVGARLYAHDLTEQVMREPVIVDRYEYVMVMVIQVEAGSLHCRIERLNIDGTITMVEQQYLENRSGTVLCEAYGGD